MGNNFGAAGDRETQTAIMRAALGLIESATEGGVIVDMPTNWYKEFSFGPGGGAS